MVTEAILNVSIKGIGKLHKTSVFPCQIFTIKDGVNKHKGEPNYDLFLLALKSTAKRLYPNYCNDDWSVQKGAVKSDREMRKSVIDSLTDEEKEKLKKNLTDEYCKYMKLDKNLNINMTEDLMEQSSTMGK